MKKLVMLLLFIAAGAGLYFTMLKPVAPEFELEEGYRALYDGRSLSGWRVVGGESSFTAEGESIVGRHGPGENTFLRTEESFRDFNLRLQVRWEEPGNSGVMFRAAQRGGDGRSFGYQYELDPFERAWSGGIYDEARRGWLANLEHNATAREAIRPDDWNELEIEARGGKLQTWINGVAAATVIDVLSLEGFIALQVHAGDAGVMRWRHIRIRELEPVATPGDSFTEEDWILEGVEALDSQGEHIAGQRGEGEAWLTTRRRLNDASVSLTVPACDEPTVVRMRYDEGETRGAESYLEASIYTDRASARIVHGGEVTEFDPVALQRAAQHRFTGVAIGSSATLSVGERDLLRVNGADIADRGSLMISPANCGPEFTLSDFSWTKLRESREEVAFYKTLDTAPAPVLSPDEALDAFRIAPGFEIELVASEPLVEEPVAMAWDEHARLYVVEMRGYMRDAYGSDSETPVGQVVRLKDTDGDGRMDTSEVFLDGLVNPRAVAVVNEGVLIGEPPNLWLCELSSREDLCARKRRVGGYADGPLAANVEHMENRLLPGLDNWLYNAKSTRRMRMDGENMITAEGPFRGQWGISKDDVGRLYYNHNSTWLQADFFQGDDIALPGVESYPEGIGVNLTDPALVYSVRVNPGVNRAYLKDTLRPDGRLYRATGASGLVIYRGDQFPEAYRGQAFVPESAGNVVAQFALREEGVGVAAEQQLYEDVQWGQRDFLGSTDERFRPVDAANGPDGALYIIDMYRGIIQDDHFLTEELREQIFQRGLDRPIGGGRIWRVRHSEGTPAAALPVLADRSTPELVALLASSNGWQRDTAQRLLLARAGEGVDALRSLALDGETVPALHAIWSLRGREELPPGLIAQLVASGDPQRQIHALRAAGGVLDAGQLLALADHMEQAPELVRMQYAFALGPWAADPAVRTRLGALLANATESAYVRQAVVRAVHAQELPFLQSLLAADRLDKNSDGAVTALRELGASGYRSIRSDLSSTEEPPAELLELLSLAQSREGDRAWQQIALLEGFQSLATTSGFVAAQLEAPPPIFSDTSISENDPLWGARLAGREAFTWPGDELALGIKPLSPEQMALMERGREFYPACANCHGVNGAGTAGLAPALAGAEWVTGPPEWLGRIILQGMSGPIEVAGQAWDGVMPPHGHLAELDDQTLAGLMTFLRRSWGNKADPVSEAKAAEIRTASAGRRQAWSAAELREVPFDRGYARFVGEYGLSFVTIAIRETREGLFMSVPMYGEGVLEQVSDRAFRGSTAGESVALEFLVDEGEPASGFVIHRDGERLHFERRE